MTNVQNIKLIPYGITDFAEFNASNFYYVDKTRFIPAIEQKGYFLFFIRPRRFGKSLFLGLLEAYYDLYYKDQFDSFFKGTYIHQNPTPKRNSYMVLRLNFSKVSANDSHIEESFLNYIRESAKRFVQRYENLLKIDINEARLKFESLKNAADVMVVLLNYCEGNEYKLYVIIDEYDNFANTILTTAGEQTYREITKGEGFFRSFFNVLKGGATDINAPISRLFISGVSPVTLDDVTSGFNIGKNISLHSDLNEMLGFTREEVIKMIEYYRSAGKIRHSTEELIELMSRWYNHYRFSPDGNTVLFNTVQVLYFLDNYTIKGKIPREMIDSNARMDYYKLRHLIIIDRKGTSTVNGNFSKLNEVLEKGVIHSDIVTSFPVEQLTDSRNFVSLLYFFGLLTISGVDEEDRIILSIPNEMVKRLYYDYIFKTYEETGYLKLNVSTYFDLLSDMAYRGNWQGLITYIAGEMEQQLGLRDLISREKAHQVFWNVYLGMNSLYNIYSENEMNQGYPDLTLVPLLVQYPNIKFSYIIELKYIKPSDYEPEDPGKLQELKEEAEAQLARYSCDEKFLNLTCKTTLKKLVLIFSGNRLVLHDEVL